MKKYTLKREGDFYRLIAARDFCDIKKGDRGGLIEDEKNLSHEGECWVFGGSIVFDDARVEGDALVKGDSKIYEEAKIMDDVIISMGARVYGKSVISGSTIISGDMMISRESKISGSTMILGNTTRVEGDIIIPNRRERHENKESK